MYTMPLLRRLCRTISGHNTGLKKHAFLMVFLIKCERVFIRHMQGCSTVK